MAQVWLQDNDGSNQVDLIGINKPWPGIPLRRYTRVGSDMQMIPGWDGTNPTPGKLVHFDFGADQSGGIIELLIPYVDSTLYTSLETKYFTAAPMLYSPDNGTNVWRVAWADGESLDPTPIPGAEDRRDPLGEYRVQIRLKIIEKTV
jgi:hypothetical protein